MNHTSKLRKEYSSTLMEQTTLVYVSKS